MNRERGFDLFLHPARIDLGGMANGSIARFKRNVLFAAQTGKQTWTNDDSIDRRAERFLKQNFLKHFAMAKVDYLGMKSMIRSQKILKLHRVFRHWVEPGYVSVFNDL